MSADNTPTICFNSDGQACYFQLEKGDVLPPGWGTSKWIWSMAGVSDPTYLNDVKNPRSGIPPRYQNDWQMTRRVPARDLATGTENVILLEPGQSIPPGWRVLDDCSDWTARPLTIDDDGAIEELAASLRRISRHAQADANRAIPDNFALQLAKESYDRGVEALAPRKLEYENALAAHNKLMGAHEAAAPAPVEQDSPIPIPVTSA